MIIITSNALTVWLTISWNWDDGFFMAAPEDIQFFLQR
jgi:hypothetical protein